MAIKTELMRFMREVGFVLVSKDRSMVGVVQMLQDVE